ncbi:hypothetical protein [Kribbella sp. NPDC049584]|uniref:hypothetical protein n=1 Tax=Kribbella sp. NPDC049584 TaxID=3154833 RepID=UPI0034240A92
MSPNPAESVKKAGKTGRKATTDAAHKVEPKQLGKKLAKELPLSIWTKIRIGVAYLKAKLKKWRMSRRVRKS